MKLLLIGLITLYQKTLSPDHGPFRSLHPGGACRFYPTCSVYGIEAIQKYGSLRGGIKTIQRIFRCHPWTDGGIDRP